MGRSELPASLNSNAFMNKDKMIEWIVTHNTGISSKTMWTALMGVNPSNSDRYVSYCIPCDGADFSRCLDLVRFCEVDQQKDFPKILSVFPWYEPVLKRWNELVNCYERNNWESFYDLMGCAYIEYCGMVGVKII